MRAFPLLFIVVFPLALNAQAKVGFDPLGLPGMMIVCQPIAVEPDDSVAFAFEFRDGNSPSALRRTTLLGFDSAGKPISMLLRTPGEDTVGKQQFYFLSVDFFPKRKAIRVVWADTTSSVDSTAARTRVGPHQPKGETLTDAEFAHAKVLAEFFWVHRCKDFSPEGREGPSKPLDGAIGVRGPRT